MKQFNLKFTLTYDDVSFVEMTVAASSRADAEVLGDVLADRMPPQHVTDYGLSRWTCTATEVAL